MKKTLSLLAVLCASTLTLGACASWDSPSQPETPTDTTQTTSVKDPQGLAIVNEVPEVEPVSAPRQNALPVTLTDADGNDVEINDTSRILALDRYGTYTKTLRGLGLSDNIVGRTVSSGEKSLEHLPVVTENGHSLNVEAILNLSPSLVIVDHSVGSPETIDQIRAAGVPTVVMAPERSIDSVGKDIEDLAHIVGEPDAGKMLAERSEKEIEQARTFVQKAAPKQPLRMSFLYARGNNGVFYLLGKESHTDDLISALGGVDVNADSGVGAPVPASPETLAELNPEVFVMMDHSLESVGNIDGILAQPGVAQTSAGQNRRVLALPDGDSLSFGPQTGQMLTLAAQALYGDQ